MGVKNLALLSTSCLNQTISSKSCSNAAEDGDEDMAATEISRSSKLAQAFFSPAVALMSRLNIARKFILLGLMTLGAAVIVVYALFISLDHIIKTSQRELHGIRLIEPIPRAIQALQQHRGLSIGLLSGDKTLFASRAGAEKDVIDALKSMEEKLPPGFRAATGEIKSEWEQIRKKGADWTIAECFAAHTRLIDRIQLLSVTISDDFALILDPELGSYYLIDTIINKLPHTLEHLGQLRAYGTGILARKQATQQERIELHILISKFGDSLEDLKISLNKAGKLNPPLHNLISAASINFANSAQQISSLVTSKILNDQLTISPAEFFNLSTRAIDENYKQLTEVLVPATEKLVISRISRAENILHLSISFATLLFLVAAYFSIGTILAVVNNIRSLANSANSIASGDLTQYAEISTQDEFSKLGESVNKIVLDLRSLLNDSRNKEARLQDLSEHLEERVRERTIELELAQRSTNSLLSRFRTLMMTSMDGIHIMDTQGNVVEANDAFCNMLGYTREEVSGLNVADWEAQSSREELQKGFKNLIGQCKLFETKHRRKDGTLIDVEVSVNGTGAKELGLIFAASRDISERKKAEEKIHNLAFYDALTKLPNRYLFLDRFEAALTASVRHNNYGAVFFIDLDRFKLLNDTYGHKFGDLLLIEVAKRIKSCVREVDTVARLGGDEFVVLIEEISGDKKSAESKARLVAEKIRETLAYPYLLGGHGHQSLPSIGASLYRGNNEATEKLLHQADLAMYQAKNAGGNTVRFFGEFI